MGGQSSTSNTAAGLAGLIIAALVVVFVLQRLDFRFVVAVGR
jgi:hypothetical protein